MPVFRVNRSPETVSAGFALRMTRTLRPGQGLTTVQSLPFSLAIFTPLMTPSFNCAETKRANRPQGSKLRVLIPGPVWEKADDALVALQQHFIDCQEPRTVFNAAAAVIEQQVGKRMRVALLAQVGKNDLGVVSTRRRQYTTRKTR